MSDLEHIKVEWDGELAIVIVDRQDKLNALNADVVREIGEVFDSLREDDNVRGVILTGAGVVALAGTDLSNFFIALILLGLGWNFGFIGATTILTSAHAPEERGRVQGMNDMIVFGCVTLASLSSGGLMNCSGGSPVEGWNAVNLAMAPFLTLAGGALIWLVLQDRARRSKPS